MFTYSVTAGTAALWSSLIPPKTQLVLLYTVVHSVFSFSFAHFLDTLASQLIIGAVVQNTTIVMLKILSALYIYSKRRVFLSDISLTGELFPTMLENYFPPWCVAMGTRYVSKID